MINLHAGVEQVNGWLLNLVLLGFFFIELAVTGYVIYLVVNHVPK